MKSEIKIADKKIGNKHPTFIIAEMGINHNGDIKIAKKMIDSAKNCGVDAVKFQTFRSEEFISSKTETYSYLSGGKKITESMYEMFKRYEFSEKQWGKIINYCDSKKIIFFSTPQNKSDLDLLLKIKKLPAIKVGSDDLTNLSLLEYYASKRLPLIISAGMANMDELKDAINCIKDTGNDKLAVLHCISSYPTEAEEVNLKKINTINEKFGVIVGFSDHTEGSTAAVGSICLGAKIIEKHFTLNKNLPGPDQWFSSNPNEMKELVQKIRYIEKALGSNIIKPTIKEIEMRKIARRSIVASQDISKGEIIKKNMVDFKRPGTGLPPKFQKDIIGKKAKKNIKKNEKITFNKTC